MNHVVRSIAFIRNERSEALDDNWDDVVSVVELAQDVPSEAIRGLEEFSHVEIVFYADWAEDVLRDPGTVARAVTRSGSTWASSPSETRTVPTAYCSPRSPSIRSRIARSPCAAWTALTAPRARHQTGLSLEHAARSTTRRRVERAVGREILLARIRVNERVEYGGEFGSLLLLEKMPPPSMVTCAWPRAPGTTAMNLRSAPS